MLRKLVVIIAVLVLLAAAGCGTLVVGEPEGPTVTRYYDFTDFTAIEIGDAFELTVTPGDGYSVAITARESLFDDIAVDQSGDTLRIDLEVILVNFSRSGQVDITMPELTGLSLSGAAAATANGFASDRDADIRLSGASRLEMDMETGNFTAALSGASRVNGRLAATTTDIDLNDASRIDLTGSGGDIRLNASGASNADLTYFPGEDVVIVLSGASHASVDVSGRLDAALSGASHVDYTGEPTLGDLDISGGSSLERL